MFHIQILLSISIIAALANASAETSGSCRLFGKTDISLSSALPVSGYKVHLQSCISKNSETQEKWIALREFESQGQRFVLLAHPQKLQTHIINASCLECQDISFNELPSGSYKTALEKQIEAPFPLANKGLIHAHPDQKGYFLSVDLCPSRKGFESEIFDNAKVKAQVHFPVAIAITGGWMRNYGRDFSWLKNQHANGQLDITWVNHSYTHPYYRGISNEKNFLLAEKGKFSDEVLKQEQYMISNGLTPSVFFRFPGLISDKGLIQELSSYGLLSLGSDAWLANGQRPTPGSVILIHGNGNEPLGVEIFLGLLRNIVLEIFKPLTQIFSPNSN